MAPGNSGSHLFLSFASLSLESIAEVDGYGVCTGSASLIGNVTGKFGDDIGSELNTDAATGADGIERLVRYVGPSDTDADKVVASSTVGVLSGVKALIDRDGVCRHSVEVLEESVDRKVRVASSNQ